MTKQSSKYKSAPMAQHYLLGCHAALAMKPSGTRRLRQGRQSAGDTRARP